MLQLRLLIAFCTMLLVVVYADAQMVTIDGHTMVRLHTFSQQFGTIDDYDAATNTYSVSRNGQTVYMVPNSSTAWINESQVNLQTAPVIVDSHLYVPLRFMLRAFGLNATWGSGFSTVAIQGYSLPNQVGFIGPQVNWTMDFGWGNYPHRWQHRDGYRIAQTRQSAPRLSFQGRHNSQAAASHASIAFGNQPLTSPRQTFHGRQGQTAQPQSAQGRQVQSAPRQSSQRSQGQQAPRQSFPGRQVQSAPRQAPPVRQQATQHARAANSSSRQREQR